MFFVVDNGYFYSCELVDLRIEIGSRYIIFWFGICWKVFKMMEFGFVVNDFGFLNFILDVYLYGKIVVMK